MGKRFEKKEPRPRDFWPTPEEAVKPLLGVLPEGFTFAEPCAGAGDLVRHLESLFGATCFVATDIEPQAEGIAQKNGLELADEELALCQVIITNPPFTWAILKPLMDDWIARKETILLLPADYMHNKRFAPYLKHCYAIFSIGRVKWIADSKVAGVDNYAWYMFSPNEVENTKFYGRKTDER